MNAIAWIHANCSFWKAAAPQQPPLSTGTPEPYDIVIADSPDIGFSQDARPCLVTRVLGNGMLEVAPITTQFGLGTRWQNPGDFQIKGEHPGFASTSLKKPSIILDQSKVIPQTAIRRRVGRLSGDILREYLDHTGR